MAEHKNKKETLRQNLEDAGCSEDMIRELSLMYETGKIREALHSLVKYRCQLLDAIHADQKMLDDLDFLICKLKKEQRYDLQEF